MKKLFLVDAYALIFRSYYAFISRPMRNSAGINTSAIFGFTKFLGDLVKRENPHYLGVAFDPKGGNFRHDLYPSYKANRDATPEDIITAVPYIKLILNAMHIPVIEIPGFEADDVIGTLSRKGVENGFEVYMVTPDKDFGQLIRPGVYIYKQRKGSEGIEIIGCKQIFDHYGISDPTQVIDILALWGDASDNIPGVPGIGEKGAIKLVGQFGTVENIIKNSTFLSGKQRENIEALRDQILLAKRLATIEQDVPVEFEPQKLVMEGPNIEKLQSIYNELGFRSFINEIHNGTHFTNSNITAKDGSSQKLSGAESFTAGNTTRIPPQNGLPVSESQTLFSAAKSTHNSDKQNVKQVKSSAQSNIQGDLFAILDSNQTANVSGNVHNAKTTSDGDSSDNIDQANGNATSASGNSGELFENAAYQIISSLPHNYHTIYTVAELKTLVTKLSNSKEFCFDTETTGLDIFNDKIIGISLSITPFEAYYVPCDSRRDCSKQTDQKIQSEGEAPTYYTVIALLKPLFENPLIAKIGQNIKFDLMVMRRCGVEIKGLLYDTMIIHYLLNPESRHGMDHLSRQYLNYAPISIEALIGKGARQLTMDMIAVERVSEYSCEDADVTLRLKELLWPMLEAVNLDRLYMTIEEPLIRTLEDIEMYGVKIDDKALAESGITITKELITLESQIREICGDPTLNVNSAKQLGDAIFGRLKIDPKPKRTKTKQYRTDEEYLQQLSDKHPVIELILEYRGLRKLLSTYIEALPQLINRETGRIHTSFNQTVTATGRLSSTNPNLQNIPIRDDRGREIRRAFIPSDSDHLILAADYSQVELRLMAHLSSDTAMIEAFENGEDIHTATAARIFGLPENEVTRDQRRKAKTANFGIIYGISAFGLAQRLRIPRSEAKEIIDNYFASYPGVKNYMDNVIEEAKINGYVTTLFGRKRFLPDITSGNAVVRGVAERNAINAPIQGGAADIMKLAMISVHQELISRGLRSRIMLQVHDELVIDLLKSESQEVTELVVNLMQQAAMLRVKLITECGIGDNWLEAH